MLRHTLIEQDGEAIWRSVPVMNWRRSFLADVAWRQILQLDKRIIVGKRTSAFGDPAQAHINGLDDVGRINDFQNFCRILEELTAIWHVPPSLKNKD